MKANKLTTQMLRAMVEGDCLALDLPDAKALRNARSVACAEGRIRGMLYAVKTDFDNLRITVTCSRRAKRNKASGINKASGSNRASGTK